MRYASEFITAIIMLTSVFMVATIDLACGQEVVSTACKTTTNLDGECVDIRDCEPIAIELIMSKQFPKDFDVEYIRANRCGDFVNRQMICCVPENRIPSRITIRGGTTTPNSALLNTVIETLSAA